MKAKLILIVMISTSVFRPLIAQEFPKEPIPTHRIIDEIKGHETGLAVWWAGHNSWLIKSDDILIGTDLALEDEEPRLYRSPISADELAPLLDISFITHEHGDHFGRATSKILAQKSECMFVMPANCLKDAEEIGIPESRIRVAIPKQPFTLLGVEVYPLRAIHGNPKYAVFEEANFEDCGYLITIGGKKILQPGDSVLLEDHLFLKRVDVLFFSPTEHNMHIQPSVILINELEPDYIFPQHRDTFRATPENRYWTTGYPYEAKNLLSKPLQQRYYILKHGERIEIR